MSSVRSLRVDVVVCLYALFLTVLSITFPLTFAVTRASPSEAHYLPALLVFLASGSLVFLSYVSLRINHFKHRMAVQKLKQEEDHNFPEPMSQPGGIEGKSKGPDSREKSPERLSLVECKSAEHKPAETPSKTSKFITSITDDASPFSFRGKGANFFMRMGIVAFGLGSVLLEGFRLFSYAEHGDVIRCFSVLFIFTSGTRLLAFILQSYFLFKYHNIVLNFEVSVMKLGVAHLVIFNLSGWFTTVALEAEDTVLKLQQQALNNSNTTLHTDHNTTIFRRLGCSRSRVIADEVGGYLYPVVVAYNMLSAALLLKIYTAIGQRPAHVTPQSMTPPPGQHLNSHCYKANSGLFAGLTVLLVTVCSICFFLYFNNKHGTNKVPGLIYLTSTLGINICALFTLPPAMYFIQKLKLIPHGARRLDDLLLLFSLGGHYLLLTIMFIPFTTQIYIPTVHGVSLKTVGCVCFLVDFIQSTVQVDFILDGVRRRSSNDHHATEKPGRSLVTFLLLCNMSTWLVNSLELKESAHKTTFTEFYGTLAWVILLYISQPMSIFFRFHSSVCLSNIWLYAYDHPLLPEEKS